MNKALFFAHWEMYGSKKIMDNEEYVHMNKRKEQNGYSEFRKCKFGVIGVYSGMMEIQHHYVVSNAAKKYSTFIEKQEFHVRKVVAYAHSEFSHFSE